jgi:hypothetical protein
MKEKHSPNHKTNERKKEPNRAACFVVGGEIKI